jgi:hypothetical protein
MKNNAHTILLSVIILVLAAIASIGGLCIQNLYLDNAFVKKAWFANDLITLFVIVPLLATAIYFTKKGSQKWLLLLMGLLAYVFYNFAFYLFGAVFNNFFLLYAALVSLSAITLFILLLRFDVTNLPNKFPTEMTVKLVSIYLFLITLMLFCLELSMIIPFILSGTIPATIIQTGLSTSVVFALDFTMVIPLSIIGAILLWQRGAWGFILVVIMLVKGVTYGLVLCVGTTLLALSNTYGKWDLMMPLYVALVGGGIVGTWLLLKNFNQNTIILK